MPSDNLLNYATPLFLLGAVALLTACEETKRALGQTKEAPDEFTVYQRAPLSLPPNYGLRPPSPGAQRPQTVNPRDRAKKALGVPVRTADRSTAGQPQNLSKLSQGERAMLNLTGATQADPGIRNLVDKDSARLFEENKSLTDKLVFWQSKGKFGIVVDPVKEQQRIREAQALGKPLKSENIPVISRKKKALFEGVLK